MKKIGLVKAVKMCSRYSKYSLNERRKVQDRRLRELVEYAGKNSPYYASLYKDLPTNYSLKDLPPVNKVELMENFDNWLTTRDVHLADIQEFMKDLDNIGRRFLGQYLIFTTSGSTGNPLVSICDKNTDNMMSAINILRTYTRKEDMKAFIRGGGRTIGIFANEGFYLGNSSVRSRLLRMPWKKKQMAVTSALLPVSEIVKQLNAFQPTMLGGYPSNLELLIEERLSGRLNIRPVIIMTGGEYLSDSLRDRLSDAFGCYVQTSYSCTEGGTIACECPQQHFHINDDWVIVEAVDKYNHPVPDGVQSDKILLTNLFNYSQPFIRYEVTDRVVMHHEACSCGNPSPWLSIEGRTDDVVSFTKNGNQIKVAPLAIYATLKEIHELRRFQLVVHKENHMELRIEVLENYDVNLAFQKAKEALQLFLATQDITTFTLVLSDEVPKQHPKSGKFKHIINELT